MPVGSPVVPTLRYRHLETAVAWLCAAFGFKPHAMVRAPDGALVSAQLTSGSAMVMLASIGQTDFDALMRQPDEIGGVETQSCYFVIENCNAHYATAKAHGAKMLLDLQEFEHGGRGYLCRDPEGHLWSFGSFDPWAGSEASGARSRTGRGGKIRRRLKMAAAFAATGAIAAGAAAFTRQTVLPTESIAHRLSAISLFKERGARIAAEHRVSRGSEDLARLQQEKDAASLEMDKLQEQIAHVSAAKEAAEQARQDADAIAQRLNAELDHVTSETDQTTRRLFVSAMMERRKSRQRLIELHDAVAAERRTKQSSDAMLQDLKTRLASETAAREIAEKTQLEAQGLLDQEREARKRLDESLKSATAQLEAAQIGGNEAATLSQNAAVPQPPLPAKKAAGPPRRAKRPVAKSNFFD